MDDLRRQQPHRLPRAPTPRLLLRAKGTAPHAVQREGRQIQLERKRSEIEGPIGNYANQAPEYAQDFRM